MAKTTKKKSTKKTSRPRGSNGGGVGKSLVVVESPAKAKTINKYLGPGYVVKASMGHVRDLPARNPKGVDQPVPGVDLEHDFAPTYQPLSRGKKTLSELKKYAQSAPEVFLATDLDREGEAIAWHLAEGLKLPDEKTRRVVFNQITQSAIREAFEHPRDIDMNMVNAQQARRILDRIVGYQVSPLLWKKVAGGLSAGRVQSVAVRLIVEREREIDAFMPEEYWRITAVFCPDEATAGKVAPAWRKFLAQRNDKGEPPTKKARQTWLAEQGAFQAELAKWNSTRFTAAGVDDARTVAEALGLSVEEVLETHDPKAKGPAQNKITLVGKLREDAPDYHVSGLRRKETRKNPYAPFTTATLQQSASVQLRFGAQRTMRIAQQLYEGIDVPGQGTVGLITYMRTDSRNLAREAVSAVRDMIGREFGQQYLPQKPAVYASGSGAQEAHEAIRPTDARRNPRNLKGCLTDEQFKLYDLIWRRFVACQMAPAVWAVTEADIAADTPAGTAQFRAMGRSLVFDGHLKVTGVSTDGEQLLPDLTEGQSLGTVDVDPTQHFTQPPPRYTEASLVKALEADSIGRPSTYASIIQTIQDRKYVELVNRSFRPTDLGTVVTDKLVRHFPKIFQVHFTAHMEDELDQVENAQADWVQVLREFYGPFKQQLEAAAEEMVHAKQEAEPSDYKCPDCDAPMEYRFGKNGKFLSCSRYPDCKKALPIDREGKPQAEQHTDIACPECGSAMNLRKGRFGPFLSCSQYPDCKGVVNLDKKGFVKHPSPPPLEIQMQCPKCESPTMNLRRSKRGPWISCSRYPKCRGRVAWSKLDDDLKHRLETDLEKHEQANPVQPVRTVDGEVVGDEHVPRITGGETVEETSAENE
jgi:DNA topoisomerase I